MLQEVVLQGTGVRAQLADGRPVAGKTGTTENYGDAWFVGYTPQLAVAVWVGYPTKLKPMLTEFHGRPVAGGTFPALIWKTFAQSALKAMGRQGSPQTFAYPPSLYTGYVSASVPFAMRFTVVSCPATRRSTQVERSSSSVSWSPASSAWTRRDRRSSRGSARRLAIWAGSWFRLNGLRSKSCAMSFPSQV